MSTALLAALKGSERSIRSLLDSKLKRAETALTKAKAKAAEAHQAVLDRKAEVDVIMKAIAEIEPAATPAASPQAAS